MTLLEVGLRCLWCASLVARNASDSRHRAGAIDTLLMIASKSPHPGLRKLATSCASSALSLCQGETDA